ncbi:MAG: hypothetical protein ACM3SQ_03505 [Betaproteobacteria bacterium]
MNAQRCPHGLDFRFCSLCNAHRSARGSATLDDVLQFLNAEQVRATYGAVGEVIGVAPRAVGIALGDRRPEASWVVNAANGLPTDYAPVEIHPALFSDPHVITSGRELLLKMAAWKQGSE